MFDENCFDSNYFLTEIIKYMITITPCLNTITLTYISNNIIIESIENEITLEGRTKK